MQVQALQIITTALTDIGYLVGENPQMGPSDASRALLTLQGIMDAVMTEGMLNEGEQTYSCSVPAQTSQILVGPTQLTGIQPLLVVPSGAPDTIRAASWTLGSSTYPCEMITDVDLWDSYQLNTLTTSTPRYFWYNQTYPLSQITFYPIPSQAITFNVLVWGFPAIPTSTSTVMNLSPAFLMWLQWRLAAEMLGPLAIPNGPQYENTLMNSAKYEAMIRRSRSRLTPRASIDRNALHGRYSSSGPLYPYDVVTDSYPTN